MKETFKPYDTEEYFDYYFFRPLASLIVKITINTPITPNQITFASLIIGVISGIFFYFDDINYILLGVVLLMISNILDCSDGQLARARRTGGTMVGRVLDGVVDGFVFFSIYLFAVLKIKDQPILGIQGMDNYGWLIWFIAVIGSIGHSMQSSFFDYYRNEYITYVIKDYQSEGAPSDNIKMELDRLKSQKGEWFGRFLLGVYYTYAKIQEKSNNKNNLKYKYQLPVNFDGIYKKRNRILLRLWSFLGASAHIVYIIIFGLFDRMDLYFIFEAVILNIYMLVLKYKQNKVIEDIEKDLVPIKNS